MDGKPTTEQLAQIAAMSDSKLSPEGAVARAREIWQAADRASRQDEIADEQELERFKKEEERLTKTGLDVRDEKISMAEAFQVQKEIAKARGTTAFKTERGFLQAMRKAKMTVTETVYGKTIEDWIGSSEPEMPVKKVVERTSRKAIEALFLLGAKGKKQRDHDRHQRNKTAVKGKSSENLRRVRSSGKRTKEPEKRDVKAKS